MVQEAGLMHLDEARAALDKARLIERTLAKNIIEVSASQALILAYLSWPCPVNSLMHWTSNPSYNVSQLCASGYLKKAEKDGRRTMVSLTAKGTAMAAKVREVIEGAAL